MFIGHFAVAFAGKRAAPRASLGVLIAAAQLVDLLWPLFLLLGWERVVIDPGNTAYTPLDFTHYPITHSLLAVVGWGVLFGGSYYAVRRQARGAVVVGLLVVSHWMLDAVTHRPDLPLYPGGPEVGLGLWNSVVGTVLVETALFAAGLWLYLRVTRARDRVGRWALWALVGFLLLIHVANIGAPPPPGVTALALVALTLWLLPPWAWWADRHRAPRRGGGP